jgi:hypothetical protein
MRPGPKTPEPDPTKAEPGAESPAETTTPPAPETTLFRVTALRLEYERGLTDGLVWSIKAFLLMGLTYMFLLTIFDTRRFDK